MSNKFIERLRHLHALTQKAADALSAATARPATLAAKHDLIREGDQPGPVFVVLEGWACRYKILPAGTRQILAFLMPGDCCDLPISSLARMDHGIQTITLCLIATIGRKEMNALMDEHPSIARALYTARLIDEGTLRAWMSSMGRRVAIERVAHLMCELYIRARIIGLSYEDELALPLPQTILADALGMTAVHLNRKLSELRERGAMRVERGRIVITSPMTLAHIAGFDDNYLPRRSRDTSAVH